MIFNIVSCPYSAEVKMTSSSCDTNVPQYQNRYETIGTPKNEAITTCTIDDDNGNEYNNERIYEEIPDEM